MQRHEVEQADAASTSAWDAPARTILDVPGLPLLGSLLDLQRDPLAMLLRGVGHDLACFELGPRTAFLLNHPELLRRVLVDRVDAYDKRTANNKVFRLLFGSSLLTSDGAYWKRQRRIAAPAFHHQRVRAFADQMRALVGEMLERWSALPDGAVVDVDGEMLGLTLDVVCRCLMGNARAKELAALFRRELPSIFAYGAFKMTRPWYPDAWCPTPKNRAFLRGRNLIRDAIGDIVKERRASTAEHDDLLSMLMDAVDEETGERMNDEQLRDEVITIVLTGYETSTNMLDWTFVALAENPDVREKLEDELARTLGDRPVTFDDLASLRYTDAIFKESLRLYPPSWLMVRRAGEDDEILGRRIPEGSLMFLSPWVIHRRPDYFPEPERFRPERFLDGPEPPRFVHIPFGGGRRICIGNAFAVIEGKIFLSEIARKFRLALTDEKRPEPLARIMLKPKDGLRMTIHRVGAS